jgi:hypothetical protein
VNSLGYRLLNFYNLFTLLISMSKPRHVTVPVSTKVPFLVSTKSKFRRNFILILSTFRCFNFDLNVEIVISISVLISTW